MFSVSTLQILAMLLAVMPPAQTGVDFDFSTLAFVLGGISLGLIGVIMAGGALFPELAQQYKRQIPNIIVGLILVGVSSIIMGTFG